MGFTYVEMVWFNGCQCDLSILCLLVYKPVYPPVNVYIEVENPPFVDYLWNGKPWVFHIYLGLPQGTKMWYPIWLTELCASTQLSTGGADSDWAFLMVANTNQGVTEVSSRFINICAMVKYVPWSSYVDYMWCYFCFIMFDLGSQKNKVAVIPARNWTHTEARNIHLHWLSCPQDGQVLTTLQGGAPWCPSSWKKIQDQASESPEKLAFAGALRTSTVGWVKSLVPKRDHIKKTVNGCGSTPVIWWIHRLFVWFRPAHGILCWAWGVQRFSIFTYILHHAGILSFWG